MNANAKNENAGAVIPAQAGIHPYEKDRPLLPQG